MYKHSFIRQIVADPVQMHAAILRTTLLLLSLLLTHSLVAAAEGNRPAPEFPADLPWLNVSRPLTMDDLRGRVVILDFWTYGCINCLHVAEELKRLEQQFGDDLLVIGVHSPKFDNERRLSTLRSMVLRYQRDHPVVNDTELKLMRLYRARAWPTLVVLDPHGGVEGYVAGEDHEELLARTIRRLLKETPDRPAPPPLPIALERERAAASYLAAPGKISSGNGRVAISDTLHHRILIVNSKGRVLQVIGDGRPGRRDGPASQARFRSPQGTVFVGNQLYVADTGNHLIRKIELATGKVSTVAGKGQIGDLVLGEFDALEIGLRSPWDLAWDGAYIYIAMAGAHQIWRYDPKQQRLTAWAGTRREGIREGEITRATFSQPSGLALHDKMLYVADPEASAIRIVDLSRRLVKTLVGTGLFDFGDRDGPLRRALLQHPLGITVAGDGTLFVADTYNHKIKVIDPGGKMVRTIVGSGRPGAGSAGKLLLNEPGGVAMLGDKVLIADTNNDRILILDPQQRTLRRWALKTDR